MTPGDRVVFTRSAGNGMEPGVFGVAISERSAVPYLGADDMRYWTQYMARGVHFTSDSWVKREVNIG